MPRPLQHLCLEWSQLEPSGHGERNPGHIETLCLDIPVDSPFDSQDQLLAM